MENISTLHTTSLFMYTYAYTHKHKYKYIITHPHAQAQTRMFTYVTYAHVCLHTLANNLKFPLLIFAIKNFFHLRIKLN